MTNPPKRLTYPGMVLKIDLSSVAICFLCRNLASIVWQIRSSHKKSAVRNNIIVFYCYLCHLV